MSFCSRCVAEDKQPKCIISRCGQDAVIVGKIISRYCENHLQGTDYDLRREGPETSVNDPKQGWRQEDPKKFGIIKDHFPIERQ